ncbi:hypothetical protein ASZ90_006523 [hydrocarbon metagenome]|uniref:Uncharacterized protein n=1 Tax=hydrocarbon metagenome TaxID=938273 RepID=A0A0W8FSD6_9ZZZZ
MPAVSSINSATANKLIFLNLLPKDLIFTNYQSLNSFLNYAANIIIY